jgi:Zn-dependent peptidase ImmA (M78 family)/transcriptional regulator with XRE-family HTH domain
MEESTMSVSQIELGRRLKIARETVSLTQDQVGEQVGLSRSAVAQIELGNRAVSSLELDRLAYLYGRDIRDFLANQFVDENALLALFRANQDIADRPETAESLRRCMAVGRELTNLERLVGLDRDLASTVRYSIPPARSRYDAIKQGVAVAEQERRRLAIGDAPVGDITELLEKQGVRTALVDLPDDVSGLTLVDREVGPFVVVNRNEHILRRTFSFGHEYAHVVLDCDAKGVISRASDRADLGEVRANAFAASFLMPEAGVRRYLATLGKGGESRIFAETPADDEDVIAIEARSAPGTQDIQLHDIVLLAAHFGVSRTVVIYRLRNLQLISDRDVKNLLELEHAGRGRDLAKLLQVQEPDHTEERNRFRYRFLSLALEAFTRDKISRAKLIELFATVLERPQSEIQLGEYGIRADDEPTGISVPVD